MLEQQQSQLVSGLKEMYHRLQKASAWEGPSLDESSGQPLTHDILSALNLLESKHDDSGEVEVFEEDCDKLQSRMVTEGANFVHRRGSISSDSDHSHHDRPKTATSRNETPAKPKMSLFKESFNFHSASSSPLTQSPIPRSKPYAQEQYPTPSPAHQLPHQDPTFVNDPQLYAPEWAQILNDMTYTDPAYRPKLSTQALNFDTYPLFEAPPTQIDAYQLALYQSQMSQGSIIAGLPDLQDLNQMDTMDFDFNNYVQQPEVMT